MGIGILGRKLGMTAIYNQKGLRIPVTVIETGPCFVTGIKTKEKHGYSAVQLGYGDAREKNTNKPRAGLFKKIKQKPLRHLKEFRTDIVDGIEVGSEFRADTFALGELVDVTGTSIGKGFQGVVKRHGFSGGKASHGSRTGRRPGSIGMCATPARVLKGVKLPGQMGNKQITVQNARVVAVDLDKNIIAIKGSITGAENGVLTIETSLKKGLKDKKWKPFTDKSIEIWKTELAELKAAEQKAHEEAEAKRKAIADKAAKKAATQAPGKKK